MTTDFDAAGAGSTTAESAAAQQAGSVPAGSAPAGSVPASSVPAGSVPPPQVWPSLRARDALGLIDFLVEALGFEATAVYTEGDQVMHAQLSWPLGGGVMLGSASESADWPLQPGTFGAYVVTDDPDALCARAEAAGAEIFQPLYDADYGSRGFAIRDPEGNLWSFGTYRGEPRG